MSISENDRLGDRFEDRVVLITGGGTGIGLAAAERFVALGARVVVTGRREEPLKAFAEAHPERAAYLSADVSQGGEAERIVAFVVERFGRLDVLVNNAAGHFSKPLVETSDDEIRGLLELNVTGVLTLTRAALPELIQRKGSVVNLSSVVSRAAVPGYSTYGTSKAAVDQITRNLAVELGPQGVRVNAVAPGLTVTPMSKEIRENDAFVEHFVAQTPLGRLGEPAEIAPAITFLASAEARWITGQVLQVSGGLLL